MKTFAMMSATTAVALVCSAVSAQGTYGNFGPRPDGFCGTQPGCVDGSCGIAACPNGQCGPAGCPGGSCGYGTAGRPATPIRPRSAAVGYPMPSPRYTTPSTQPFYGTGASMTCPNGNCPRVPVASYTTGYRAYPTTPNCPNGQCQTAPVPRRPAYQAPRFNFLGLNW